MGDDNVDWKIENGSFFYFGGGGGSWSVRAVVLDENFRPSPSLLINFTVEWKNLDTVLMNVSHCVCVCVYRHTAMESD